MSEGDPEAEKRRAAEAAVEYVEDGMVVGLGSGSTAAYAIECLGEAVANGLSVVGVPTSFQSAALARSVGVPVRSLEDVTMVDVAIDGADQVASGALIKGGGAAHTREKLVDAAADTFVVVVDSGKMAETLDQAVPLEVLPDAPAAVARQVSGTGGTATIRSAVAKSGPVVTDNGNLVLDADFGEITDPTGLASRLSTIPGVIDHGLFVGLADVIITGTADGTETRQ